MRYARLFWSGVWRGLGVGLGNLAPSAALMWFVWSLLGSPSAVEIIAALK